MRLLGSTAAVRLVREWFRLVRPSGVSLGMVSRMLLLVMDNMVGLLW